MTARLWLSEADFIDRFGSLVAGLTGNVVEIGPGTGANFADLSPGARWTGIEPSVRTHPELRRGLVDHGISGRVIAGRAESLPMVDNSVDAVLASYVLCSVTEPETVLSEILRVLRPGGVFCFAEHVIPEGGLSRRVIRALAPLSMRLQGGCDPSRDTATTIAAAGFVSVDESWTLTRSLGLRIPRLCGVARAPGRAANPISRRFSA